MMRACRKAARQMSDRKGLLDRIAMKLEWSRNDDYLAKLADLHDDTAIVLIGKRERERNRRKDNQPSSRVAVQDG